MTTSSFTSRIQSVRERSSSTAIQILSGRYCAQLVIIFSQSISCPKRNSNKSGRFYEDYYPVTYGYYILLYTCCDLITKQFLFYIKEKTRKDNRSIFNNTYPLPFTAAPVCVEFSSTIDSWPWAILIILHRYLLICTGYRTPSVFLTRSVFLYSNVWKAWPLPIFLISALALQLLWVVLVWDLQLEVISLCRDTGLSGVQGLLLWLVRNVGTNFRLDSGISRLVLRLSLNTWKHTCS